MATLVTEALQKGKPRPGGKPPVSKPEDQKGMAKAKPEDQKSQTDKPKTKKKKTSNTVMVWRKLIAAKACTSGKITFTDEFRGKNPKRGKAAIRYTLYKEGMDVPAYIEVSNKAGNAKAQAQTDVRWDVASGFILVDGKTAEQILASVAPAK